MAVVEIRYWASARAAAGTERDVMEVDSVREAVAQARRLHPDPEFDRVLGLCSLLHDGRRVEPDDDTGLVGHVELEALPPSAGG